MGGVNEGYFTGPAFAVSSLRGSNPVMSPFVLPHDKNTGSSCSKHCWLNKLVTR